MRATRVQMALLLGMLCVCLMSGVARAATNTVRMRFAGEKLATSAVAGPPTAAFSYSPGAPVTGQAVSFDGSASSCPDAPCTYSWADDPPSGGTWALGSGQKVSFTFQVVGTKYVTLTATDAAARTASVEHNVVVTVAAPAAPTSTVAPQLSGTAQQAQTLTVSNGSWTGSPSSYADQWQDCNSSGASCANISSATKSSYTLAASDVGQTMRAVVTASNSSGASSAPSTTMGPVSAPATGSGACDLNATTSNFTTQIANATAGQVVCLASGNYSGFTGTSKSAPGITITSAPGATVTFNSGMTFPMSTDQNFTLDGTVGGGTMSIGGEVDMETSGDAAQNKALNITLQNIAFQSAFPDVQFDGPENSNVSFNRDTFVDVNAPCPSGFGGIFYVYNEGTPPTGLTVENSVLVAPTDLWNPGRGVQDGAPMTFKNNVMTGFLDHTEGASCTHIDGLQWYSGTNGTVGSVTFTGNLCYDDYGCAMAFDGTSSNTITDNACFDTETACINLYSDTGSVVNHNVEQTRGADPGGCNTMYEPSAPIQACTYSQLLISSHKSGDRATSGQSFTNNIDPSAPNVESGDLATNTTKLWPAAGSPNISGSPTFGGGANPTTWAGFELSAGSTGHDGGSDGLDVGVRASAGGPPTGGGSAPVNTVAPALTGTATPGDTLTTTNGAWTITGGVPTATTYQWFDCPTSTFAAGSCPAIQPQTAPTSANATTYTLGASDSGDYVFSMVTVTNANGQVNAISNAVGPVAP